MDPYRRRTWLRAHLPARFASAIPKGECCANDAHDCYRDKGTIRCRRCRIVIAVI